MSNELNDNEWNEFHTWSTYLYKLVKEKINWMTKCMSLLSKYPNLSSEQKIDYIVKSENLILQVINRSQCFDGDKEKEKEYVSHRDSNEHKFVNRPKSNKSDVLDELRRKRRKRKSKRKGKGKRR